MCMTFKDITNWEVNAAHDHDGWWALMPVVLFPVKSSVSRTDFNVDKIVSENRLIFCTPARFTQKWYTLTDFQRSTLLRKILITTTITQ